MPNVRAVENFVLTAVSLAVFFSYLVREWLAFFQSQVFTFTNGWDEQFYLSWQTVLAGKSELGLFPLYASYWMHRVGISGAVQNLWFDTLLTPFTVYLVYLTLRTMGRDRVQAFAQGTLICFASVLFNLANPLIKGFIGESPVITNFFMAGLENYPSLLRTPNPQASYLVMAAAVFAFVKFRRPWLLMLPLPFLYYYVAVPYGFALVLAVFYKKMSPIPAAIACWVICGLGLVVASYAMGLYVPEHPWRSDATLFVATRGLQMPLALAILCLLSLLAEMFGLFRECNLLHRFIFLAAVIGCSVNLHLFTGFMLSQKNYYDYGISIFLGLLAVTIIDGFASSVLRSIILAGTLITCGLLTFKSHGWWYEYALERDAKMRLVIDLVRQDPMHAIIPDPALAGHFAYSAAQMLAPPLSYFYFNPLTVNQCADFPLLMRNALKFASQNLPDGSEEMVELQTSATTIAEKAEKFTRPATDFSYCAGIDFSSERFSLFAAKN